MAALALCLALAALVMALLALSMKEPEVQLAAPVRLILAGTAVFGLGFAMEMLFNDWSWLLFWNSVQYVGLGLLLVGFGLLLMNYLGIVEGWDRRSILLASVVPLFILVMVSSDPWHGLYYASIERSHFAGYSYLETTREIGWAVTVGYIMLLCLGVLAQILRSLTGATSANVVHMSVLAAAVILGMGSSLLPNPVAQIPTTLVIFSVLSVMALPLYQVTFRGGLSLHTLSYRQVLDLSPDIKVMMGEDGRVIYSNQRAKEALGDPPSLPYGIKAFLEGGHMGYSMEEVDLVLEGERRHYSFDAMPLSSRNGVYQGIMVSMRDITPEVRIRNEVQMANEKLRLMSSISRHDILNQLTVISGSAYLLEEMVDPQAARRIVGPMQRAVDSMNRQLSFMRDHERLGENEPGWQALQDAAEEAAGRHNLGDIDVSIDVKGIELWADPMLPKVFSNLIDNSLVHGEGVSSIAISADESNGLLRIIYRDDGGGIPPQYRDGLFDKGVGRNSGLGLFLSRSILELTGIGIREEGPQGEGVEFIIEAPPGKWRAEGRAQ